MMNSKLSLRRRPSVQPVHVHGSSGSMSDRPTWLRISRYAVKVALKVARTTTSKTLAWCCATYTAAFRNEAHFRDRGQCKKLSRRNHQLCSFTATAEHIIWLDGRQNSKKLLAFTVPSDVSARFDRVVWPADNLGGGRRLALRRVRHEDEDDGAGPHDEHDEELEDPAGCQK
eukprot:3093937-Pleurochrysis_carterae.AAC.1